MSGIRDLLARLLALVGGRSSTAGSTRKLRRTSSSRPTRTWRAG
jgi:hypothetical protein